jgi:hypothetical protein
MASNHVQPDPNLQNAAMFGDSQDAFNYNNLYSQGQAFSNNLLSDQQNPHLTGTPSHSPYNSAPAFSPPAWQTAATSSSISNPQANQYLSAGRGYFGVPSPSTTTSFTGGHGVQFNHNVDLSLFRQGNNRAFGQAMGLPSTTSQSATTIAPTSLHQVAQANQQPAAPGSAMQSVFSAQLVDTQQRDMVHTPVINGSNVSHAPNGPKGTQSGNFIIVSYEELAKATQTTKLHNYVNLGSSAVELNLTRGMHSVLHSSIVY